LKQVDGFGFSFDETVCDSCEGDCCIGQSGIIWIDEQEAVALSNHLFISIDKLKQNYLYKVQGRYSIKERKISKDNFACIFFDMELKRCSIYDLRPKQCRTFPFWDYFKHNNIEELKKECKGVVV